MVFRARFSALLTLSTSTAGPGPEKKNKASKSGKSEAGKSQRGAKNKKRGDEDDEGTGEPIRVLQLPAIMPPPPCLFLEAILPQGDAGNNYTFEGWSLNQLDGLASDFGELFVLSFFVSFFPDDYNKTSIYLS